MQMGKDVQYSIQGDDKDVLEKYAVKAQKILKTMPGVTDVNSRTDSSPADRYDLYGHDIWYDAAGLGTWARLRIASPDGPCNYWRGDFFDSFDFGGSSVDVFILR
jgi:hypothetical protein